MGGQQSKNTSEVITDISVNVAMDSIMTCTTSASQSQLLSLQNVRGNVTISDVSMKQGASISTTCVMDANKQNEIAGAVSSAISQHAEAKGQAVVSALGRTRSEVESKIYNKLTNNISAITSMELNSQIKQIQAVTAENIGGNVVVANLSMEQSAELVARALMKTQSYSSVINETAQAIDQVTKTEEENPIAGIISSVGDMMGKMFSAPVLMIGALLLGVIAIFVVIKLAMRV